MNRVSRDYDLVFCFFFFSWCHLNQLTTLIRRHSLITCGGKKNPKKQNVFLSIDNLIPCEIRDERKRQLRLWTNSLPSHREVKALSQTLDCTSEVLSFPPETEGPGGGAETLALLIAPAAPVNKHPPTHPTLLTIFLTLPVFSLLSSLFSLPRHPLPGEASGGGGSFDYLCCRLIAFLNLCTDVAPTPPRSLLHAPTWTPARRGRKKQKQTNHAAALPPHLLPITDLHPLVSPGTLSRTLSVYLLCLFSLVHCSSSASRRTCEGGHFYVF